LKLLLLLLLLWYETVGVGLRCIGAVCGRERLRGGRTVELFSISTPLYKTLFSLS